MIPSYYDAPDHPEGSVPMRGDDPRHDTMFSYVTPEARVRADHPLRPIRKMTDAALQRRSPRFDRLYSATGRPSIPPEKLLRALLLQFLYSIRSERLLMEELEYSILYRWFVGLGLDDPVWDATTFTTNRDRLLDGEIADAFFGEAAGASDVLRDVWRDAHRADRVDPVARVVQLVGADRDAPTREGQLAKHPDRGVSLPRRTDGATRRLRGQPT
jgi:transposase